VRSRAAAGRCRRYAWLCGCFEPSRGRRPGGRFDGSRANGEAVAETVFRQMTTRRGGTFSFQQIGPGTFEIVARLDGKFCGSKKVTVRPRAQTRVRLDCSR
jgi:hypothetical protein